jgi:hypothetical protein
MRLQCGETCRCDVARRLVSQAEGESKVLGQERHLAVGLFDDVPCCY